MSPSQRRSHYGNGVDRTSEPLKSGRPPCAGRTRDSPSRFRFRPPRPTGLSPRDCSLFVRPLGRGFDLLAPRARRKEEPTQTTSRDQGQASTFLSQFARRLFATGDPDAVLAAGEGPAVEPAVALEHLEAGLGEERVPPLGLEPPERHRRGALPAAHRECERLLREIPVGALVDSRLALDPAAVCRLDVLPGRREDVEDEAPAGPEQLAGRPERLQPLLVL